MSVHPALSDGLPGLERPSHPPLHCCRPPEGPLTLDSLMEVIDVSPCEPGGCAFVVYLLCCLVGWRCHITNLGSLEDLPALHCTDHMPAAGVVPVRLGSQMHPQSLAPAAHSLARGPEIQLTNAPPKPGTSCAVRCQNPRRSGRAVQCAGGP